MERVVLVPFWSPCATVPTGPSVLVRRGRGKACELCQGEGAVGRQWAHPQMGRTPGAAASGMASAVVGTALGAVAGLDCVPVR